jgi:hypothetical protein
MDHILELLKKADDQLSEAVYWVRQSRATIDHVTVLVKRLGLGVSIAQDLSHEALQRRIDDLDPIN